LVELAENEVIRIPLYTEQVFIEKRPVVAEEVLVSKRNIQEIRRYTDTVRREEARLEREGNVIIRGDRLKEVTPPAPRRRGRQGRPARKKGAKKSS
jgi:stress response protein YsnF